MKNQSNILKIILPHKKINIFIIFIVIIGVTCGALFANLISLNDHNEVIEKIKSFIDNIATSKLNHFVIFKNSLLSNIVYNLLIWIFGMTLIGLIMVIFLTLIKSFIVGFSLSAFIMTYHHKGIILSSLYLLLGEFLNIIAIILLSIYSIMFTHKLLKLLFKPHQDNIELLKFLKTYLLILIIALSLNIISALSESFILPAIIKLIIKLYS